jgi:hypothetical protein
MAILSAPLRGDGPAHTFGVGGVEHGGTLRHIVQQP